MRNFFRIGNGVDVGPILHALAVQPELWNQNTLRTNHPDTPHKAVDDVWLRFQDVKPYLEGGDASAVVDENESIPYEAWSRLPQTHGIIFDLMRRVHGTRLGRVLITRLPPGKQIEPHEDGGAHAAYYRRYHVMLQNAPGSLFHCGDETVTMFPGEVWWFNNALTHSVVNNSADDRITMIVDIRIEPK